MKRTFERNVTEQSQYRQQLLEEAAQRDLKRQQDDQEMARAGRAEDQQRQLLRMKRQQAILGKSDSAIVIQKYVRRMLVKKTMESLQGMFKLRQFIMDKNVKRIEQFLLHGKRPDRRDARMYELFEKCLAIGRAMVKVSKVKADYCSDLEHAVEQQDFAQLTKLLLKSEKLELPSHPLVIQARNVSERLHRKLILQQFMKDSVAACAVGQLDVCDSVEDAIVDARALGVDEQLVFRFIRLTERAGPHELIRTRLRRAVETVDRVSILRAIEAAETERKDAPLFADLELRAAQMMLMLIASDDYLRGHGAEFDSGPLLTDELLKRIGY